MRDKRTFITCARLLPYRRPCRTCPHHNCALRDINNPYEADSHEEKAMAMFVDDNRQRITESFVLNTGTE